MAETRLDTDTTAPSRTAPGDGAHDTTDPLERASTVVPTPGREALAAGTVNIATPLPAAGAHEDSASRWEFPTAAPTNTNGAA